jgi:hypothetical protein
VLKIRRVKNFQLWKMEARMVSAVAAAGRNI